MGSVKWCFAELQKLMLRGCSIARDPFGVKWSDKSSRIAVEVNLAKHQYNTVKAGMPSQNGHFHLFCPLYQLVNPAQLFAPHKSTTMVTSRSSPNNAPQKSISAILSELGILHIPGKRWPQRTSFCWFSWKHACSMLQKLQFWDGVSIFATAMSRLSPATLPDCSIWCLQRAGSNKICFGSIFLWDRWGNMQSMMVPNMFLQHEKKVDSCNSTCNCRWNVNTEVTAPLTTQSPLDITGIY